MERNKYYSITGTAYFLLATVPLVITGVISELVYRFAPQYYDMPLVLWLISLAPLYMAGMPLCRNVMMRLPRVKLFQSRLSFGKWMKIFSICMFVMYAGSLIGNLVSMTIGACTNLSMEFTLEKLIETTDPIFILLFSVILAPILEELVFRKLLIDRMIVFGDKAAILLSGFLFGLFHGNFYQLFYAFGLGCVLAYVYIRTGNIGYTISLHMAVNFIGGFVSSLILRGIDFNALESGNPMLVLNGNWGMIFGYFAYILLIIVLFIVGLILLLTSVRQLRFYPGEYTAPAKIMAGYMFQNAGMWRFILISVVIFVFQMVFGK